MPQNTKKVSFMPAHFFVWVKCTLEIIHHSRMTLAKCNNIHPRSVRDMIFVGWQSLYITRDRNGICVLYWSKRHRRRAKICSPCAPTLVRILKLEEKKQKMKHKGILYENGRWRKWVISAPELNQGERYSQHIRSRSWDKAYGTSNRLQAPPLATNPPAHKRSSSESARRIAPRSRTFQGYV